MVAMRTKQQVAKCCPPLGEGVAEDPVWIASSLFGVRNDVSYAGAEARGIRPPLYKRNDFTLVKSNPCGVL